MSKQEFIDKLTELETLVNIQLELISTLDSVFGGVDGPLTDAIFKLQSFAVKQLEDSVGDKDGWVDWYLFERPTTAIDPSGLKHEINSPEDLVEFVGWFEKEQQ